MARRSSILDEYLVSLGFRINRSQLNEVDRSLKRIRDVTNASTASFAKSITVASAGVAAVLATASAGVVAYINNVAQADLQTQLFARRLWISNTAARSLNTTLDALGYSFDQIYDIAANPELASQFLRLRSEINSIEAPQELNSLLKGFRELTFEFSRFRGLLSQGSRWVSYWFLTDFNEQITTVRASLQAFNDMIKENLPTISRTISRWFGNILQVVNALGWGFKNLFNAVKNVFGQLSSGAKFTFGGLLAGLLALNNPIFAAIAAITAFLLLLEDLYAYSIGGNSYFAGFWETLDKGLFNREDASEFDEALSGLLTSVNNLVTAVGNLFDAILRLFGLDAEGSSLVKGLDLINTLVTNLTRGVTVLVDLFTHLVNGLTTIIDAINLVVKSGLTSLEDAVNEASDPTNQDIINNPNFQDAEDFRVYQQRLSNASNFRELYDLLNEYGTFDALKDPTQFQIEKQVNEEDVKSTFNGEGTNFFDMYGSIGGYLKEVGSLFIPPWLKNVDADTIIDSNIGAVTSGAYYQSPAYLGSSSTSNDNRNIIINNNINGAKSPRATAAEVVKGYENLLNNKSTKGWQGTQTTIQEGIQALTGGGG